MLDLYRRDDNPLFVPETGGNPRLLFFVLGRQAIGFSPFGIDFTRIRAIPDAARPKDELLTPLGAHRQSMAPRSMSSGRWRSCTSTE